MITTTIKLQNFASYSPSVPVTVTLTKPIAVFYGHNGTGKSTIVKAIRHYASPELGPAGSCAVVVEGLLTPEFLIYDTSYVEENFHPKEGKGIRGIFTLGKKTAEELEEIQSVDGALLDVKEAGQQATARLAQLNVDSERAFESAKDATWTIKVDYEKGPLRFCLEDNKVRGDRAKLFRHLSRENDGDGSIQIEDLLREALELEDESVHRKSVITPPDNNFSELESNQLLGSVVAGSSDSKLSALISTLKNEGWVRNGVDQLHDSNGACPFCQQMLPHDFSNEISKLFDTAYQDQCSQLSALRKSYGASVESLTYLFTGAPYQDDYVTNDLAFQNSCKDLRLIVENNLTLIDKKLASPSDPIALTSSSKALAVCRDLAAQINSKIDDYNARIANRDQVRKVIDQRFWKKMRHDHRVPISTYETTIAAIETERSALNDKVERLRKDYRTKDARLRELRASSTSIDASVDAINQRIANIGIQGFRIEKDGSSEGYYHIARGSQGKIDYRSLSEGEKSLVTFLYFFESLYGSHNADGLANKASRVIVIDDPISSLSHNHVYDVASLITLNLIEPKEFPQIIILTHSLFFYHELFKAAQKKSHGQYQCFRVSKNEFSTACEMSRDEIKNDYQSFWLVLKEGIASHKYSVALPIAMRYVLEHYFTFIGIHDKLNDALLSLGNSDKSFHAFYRYINRQSHSDNFNISDLPSIDPIIYVEKFKQVFECTGQLEHFNRMMGNEPTEAT